MKLSDYDFELPNNLIALEPVSPRDHSRLLKVEGGDLRDYHFYDLPKFLKTGDIIVFNNSKVIKAKFIGFIDGKKISINLNKSLNHTEWEAFAKPAKKIKEDDIIKIAEGFEATVISKCEFGRIILKFNKSGNDLFEAFDLYGEIPLPPYIKRENKQEDHSNYQTIYAKDEGSVAAPTAGLHFTNELLEKIREKGVEVAFVTLHVGAGTFLPIKSEDINEHKMHSEYCYIDKENVEKITKAKLAGGRVFAVGTTSMRILESVADQNGNLKEFYGETSIFIKPGYKFKIVDCLITNFHLPKSSLLVLVSAFAGFDEMKSAYKYAIENKYRFFSYGDASILFRKK